MEIKYRLLGVPALRIGDRLEQEWAQSKPRGMFCVLLLRPRQPVSVTELTDWMWEADKVPADPAGALATYRKRIASALGQIDSPPRIHSRNGTYRLDVDKEEIDLHEFRRRVDHARATARQGDHSSAARLLASAVDELWTEGELLPDLKGDRAANWRRMAMSEHIIPAHSALLSSWSTLGEHEKVLRRIADLPLDFRLTLAMIKHRLTALHAVQRHHEAQEYYLDQRKRLQLEGSLDEADELMGFQAKLQENRPEPRFAVTPTPPLAQVPDLLPLDVLDFTGRENLLRHLDSITTASDGRPLPTTAVLTGDPGVGKTALAVHWAHLTAERFPGGRFYQNLGGFGDGPPLDESEVINEFLAALGVPAAAALSLSGRKAKLRILLSVHRALVVLDNVRDHVQIGHLLDCLGNCTVLVTSRSRLPDLVRRGVAVVPVLPLTYTEGKTWLAKWLGPRASAEAAAASDLVGLCGGIALVLRIVAGRVQSRPGVALAEFVEELRDERTMLGLGGRGSSQEGSVRAALGWSYHALDAEEQRLFRLLGIHPGPDVSIDAVAALAGQSRGEVQRGLDILVDFHLLGQPQALTRFRLHDLLRRYARELAADSDEKPTAEQRLLSFFLSSAQNADRVVIPNRVAVITPPAVPGVVPVEFTDEDSVMRWAARERANINSLLRYAAACGLHEFVSKMPSVIGEIFQRLGHRKDVADALRMSIQAARLVGDRFEEASCWGNLGFIQLALREFEAAMDSLVTARTMSQQVDYPLGIAVADLLLGRLAVERGDFRRGIEIQSSALNAFRRLGAAGEEAIALYRLGEANRRSGNLETAATFCRDAIWQAERIGETHTKGCAYTEIAAVHLERGELAEAEGYCERALQIHENNDFAQLGTVHNILASVHSSRSDHRAAERHARRALTYCRGAHDIRGQAQALRMIADLLYGQARHEEAAESWSLALTLFETVDDRQAATDIQRRLSEISAAADILPERTESLQPPRRISRSGDPVD